VVNRPSARSRETPHIGLARKLAKCLLGALVARLLPPMQFCGVYLERKKVCAITERIAQANHIALAFTV